MKSLKELIYYLQTHDKTLVVFCAPPCSGKTTIIKQITDKVDIKVVSSDDIIVRMAEGKTYNEIHNSLIKVADKEYKETLNDLGKTEQNVISDRTNVNPKSRRKVWLQFKDHVKIAVYVKVDSFDTIQQRNINRGESDDKYIPFNIIKSMYESTIAPIKEEGFDYVITIEN